MTTGTNRKVSTAYVGDQANDYDRIRFMSRAGNLIHKIEEKYLIAALSHIGVGSPVLEVGCGTGRFIICSAKAGMDCHGVDPSPDMLHVTEDKLVSEYSTIKLQVGEGAALPFGDDSFDLVYSIRVLNQTESENYAYATIREMVRTAKPGGYILVEFMSKDRSLITGKNRSNDIELPARQVTHQLQSQNCQIIWLRGAFLAGMSAYLSSPSCLIPVIKLFDRVFSYLLPRYCSRCYVLARKASQK